jgi:hypothetical protein
MLFSLRLLALSLTFGCGSVWGTIPNGDFESPAGSAGAWLAESAIGTYDFNYPATGGNPDGFGTISHTGGGGFGLWVSNNGDPLTLASLGLVAGNSYTFLQDMKILAGTKIGGFKIDFFKGDTLTGSTGELYPTSGTSVWTTYAF